MPTARGWPAGRTPVAAPGLKVNAFATGLKHPRWIHVLPNGDVLTAESLTLPGQSRTVFDIAINATMKRAAAQGPSPNRIILLRDADGDGVAETRDTYLENLRQPFGMALVGDTFYVGNTDGLVAFPFEPGATRLTGPGKRLAEFKPGGHWTRSLLPNADGSKIYVGVGSLSNIAEAAWRWRKAAPASGSSTSPPAPPASSPAACATRSASPGSPATGALWTVVNERDGLGDETPPDYLTSVRDGGFYGWPCCYWGRIVDDRVPQDPRARRHRPHARLRPRRPHRLPRPLLAPRRHPPRLPRRHGHRPARLVEPLEALGLQGDLRPLRERQTRRPGARHPHRLPLRRRDATPTAARSASPSAPTARSSSPTTSATSSGG